MTPADEDVLRFMSDDLSVGEWSERLSASPTEILAFLRAEGLAFRPADSALEMRILRDIKAYGSSRATQLASWLKVPVEDVLAATRDLVSRGRVATSNSPVDPEIWAL